MAAWVARGGSATSGISAPSQDLAGKSWNKGCQADLQHRGGSLDYEAKQGFDPQWVRRTRTGVNPPTGDALGEMSRVTGHFPVPHAAAAAKFYF